VLDEDIDHLLFSCHCAQEVWHFFRLDFADRDPFNLADLLFSNCSSFEATTIITAVAWNI
jgi:hypothetical protein